MLDFVHEGTDHNSAEQSAMAHKGSLFGHTTPHHRIMASPDPAKHKTRGRAVSGFGDGVWVRHRLSINRQANLSNFGLNPDLLRSLLGRDNKILAEASPYDIIWGICFRAVNARAYQPSLQEER